MSPSRCVRVCQCARGLVRAAGIEWRRHRCPSIQLDGGLLEAIADQAAITIRTTRLIAQLDQTRQQLASLQSHVTQAVDEYKSAYPMQLKFDYAYKPNEAPFDIQSIYHDDKFTYIKTNAPEKFSVYEMKDGKPNLITYDLREGTYIIPKVMDSGYVELGKKRMDFTRKG